MVVAGHSVFVGTDLSGPDAESETSWYDAYHTLTCGTHVNASSMSYIFAHSVFVDTDVSFVRTRTHTYTHTCARTRVHTHAHTHARTHTRTRTRTHTLIFDGASAQAAELKSCDTDHT